MADKTFRLEIIAPDRIFYSNDIYMVEYNTVEGRWVSMLTISR